MSKLADSDAGDLPHAAAPNDNQHVDREGRSDT